MSLTDLASLATVVSSAGVLATMVLLLVQLRHSNNNQRALIQQGRSVRQVDTSLALLQPHLQTAVSEGFGNSLSMSAAEQGKFLTAVYVTLINFEDSYLQHRAGTIAPSSWESDMARWSIILSIPAFRACWRLRRDRFCAAFREHVDGMLRDVRVVANRGEFDTYKKLLSEELASVPPETIPVATEAKHP